MKQALLHSRLVSGRTKDFGKAIPIPLNKNAALLYPGRGSRLISDLKDDEKPEQLVVLDGTWHQAKTLFRDVPCIGDLPRYHLSPEMPGEYRIRLEPTDTSLSTIEAVAQALSFLEPQTIGLEGLYHAFNTMIETQLAHPKASYDGTVLERRKQAKPNIPHQLIHNWNNLVLAYGESIGGERAMEARAQGIKRKPVFWVAQRLRNSETFACAIESGHTIDQQVLEHLRLDKTDFSNTLSSVEMRRRWLEFIQPHETLVVYNSSTLGLLKQVDIEMPSSLVLKAVKLDAGQANSSLECVLDACKLVPESNGLPGRAGKRLGGLLAYARHLKTIGEELDDNPMPE